MTSEELDAILARSPYVARLGAKASLHGDELTLVLPFRDDHIGNPMLPAIHGGVLGAVMEIAATAQLFVQLGLKRFPRPIDVSVDYLRSAKPRDLFARAIIARKGRRVANVRVEAWQETRDELTATLHGHFLIAREDRS